MTWETMRVFFRREESLRDAITQLQHHNQQLWLSLQQAEGFSRDRLQIVQNEVAYWQECHLAAVHEQERLGSKLSEERAKLQDGVCRLGQFQNELEQVKQHLSVLKRMVEDNNRDEAEEPIKSESPPI